MTFKTIKEVAVYYDVICTDAVYANARNGTGTLDATQSGTHVFVSNSYNTFSEEYTCGQAFCEFDLSEIPYGSTVFDAGFIGNKQMGAWPSLVPGDDVRLVEPNTYNGGVPLTTDFEAGGSLPLIVLARLQWPQNNGDVQFDVPFPNDFRAAVERNCGGTFPLMLYHDGQKDATVPTGDDFWAFNDNIQTWRLEVTWHPPAVYHGLQM